MKITVGRRSAVLGRVAIALASCAALRVTAAPAWPLVDPPPPAQSADVPRPTVFRFDAAEERNVIVEFNAPPLLVARKPQQVRAASAALDTLSAQLVKDIDRIEGRGSGPVWSQSSERTVLRREYRMTFAGASVRVSRGALSKIRALSYVRAVYEDRQFEAYLQNSVPQIHVPEVRAKYGRRGNGIVVAIIDTGVNYKHWALGKGFGTGFKVVGGYDFVNDDGDPMDDYGHGTHVAGIVAGDVAPVIGVAPAATLLAYKVLDAHGSGELSDVMAGVERTVDPNGDGDPADHADVANMSLGGGRQFDDPLVRAVETASAAGVIFCVAAGNSFAPASIGSPGVAPSAITVGATDSADVAAPFTSRGPIGGTWAVKPEIAAPGVGIVSAFEDRTLLASGTSMATPHVSGVVALLLEEHPSWTVDDIKAALVSTAKPVLVQTTGAVDIISAGGGRIDALAAFEASIFPSPATVTFGIVPNRGQPHTSTAKVTLRNRGSSAETLRMKVASLASGGKLTMTPESVLLDAGSTAEVTFTLELPDTATPEFTEAPLSMTGMIELTGTQSALHLPWLIVTGDVLSATYGGTDDYAMYISRGMSQAAMWPAGPRTWGAFVEATLAADVMVLSQSEEDAPVRVIIRERQTVEGFTPITILPEEASLELAVAGVDERGVPLGEVLPADLHAVWHELTLPSLTYIRLIYTGSSRSIHINPLKETSIRTYETLFTGSSRYFGAYRLIRRGFKASETLTLAAGDWATQRIHHRCKTECMASVGAGVYHMLDWDYFLLPPGEGTWDLHITPPSTIDTSDFRAHVLVREKGWKVNTSAPWTFLSGAFRNTRGRMATSIFGRATAGDYFPPDRVTPVPLGEGPVVLHLTMGRFMVALEPYAPLGDTLGENAFKIKLTRTQLDGATTGAYPSRAPGYFDVKDVPGKFELVATDEYEVAGRPGKVTLTARYDSRLHAAAPALSMLLVEDGRGAVAWTVPAQSQPRLVFAARLSAYDKWGFNVEYEVVNPAGTRVWWRRHGTSEWLPLAVSMTGEDNAWFTREPGSPGTLFAASLAAATQEEGEIDLKIGVQDTYGGTSETVYEPAFVVGSHGVRRRAVH